MRRALWSEPAERRLEEYLDYLAEHDVRVAARARRNIHAIADQTARMPGLARPSLRWPGFNERSVPEWSKLLVLRITDDQVRVLAFLDTRQNLDHVNLGSD